MKDFDQWETLDASTGGGQDPNFPDGGSHEVDIVGFDEREGSFRYKLQDGSRTEVPATLFRLNYEYELDPQHPSYKEGSDNIVTFGGDWLSIVPSNLLADLPEEEGNKAQTRANINHKRLKGFMSVVLRGELSGNSNQDTSAFIAEISGNSAIPVQIEVQTNEYKGTVYKTEYLKNRLD